MFSPREELEMYASGGGLPAVHIKKFNLLWPTSAERYMLLIYWRYELA